MILPQRSDATVAESNIRPDIVLLLMQNRLSSCNVLLQSDLRSILGDWRMTL